MPFLEAPDELNLYYSAGLMEGASSFCARAPYGVGERWTPRVITSLDDATTIEWLRDLWGGVGTTYLKFKRTAWEITGRNAANLMVAVYPALGTANQAKVAEILEACGYEVPESEADEVEE